MKDDRVDGQCAQTVSAVNLVGLCQNQAGHISTGRSFSIPNQPGQSPVDQTDCTKAGRCFVTTSTSTNQAHIAELIAFGQPLPPECAAGDDPATCIAKILFEPDLTPAEAADLVCFNESKTWTFFGVVWNVVTVEAQALLDGGVVATTTAVCTSPEPLTVIEQTEPFVCQ